jgi:hypothetical protein
MRNIREENALGMMVMMILWKEGWLSEKYLPSGVKELNHLMRHVVKRRLEGWHSIVPSEGYQCYPMGRWRIYENQTAPQGVSRSRPKTKVEFDARDKRAEVVAVCVVPNGREHRT